MAPSALVSGCSRGIGLQLVAELLKRGYVVIAAVRNPDSPKLAELAGSGGGAAAGRLHIVQLDAGSPQSIATCVESIKQHVSHLDLVLNNAGVQEELRPFGQVTADDFMDVFKVNAIGPFLLTQQLRTAGLIGPPGSIVANTSSILGSMGTNIFQAYPGYAYRASKAALNSLTKYSDVALAKEGVSCVAIHPGYVKTDINQGEGDISAEESAQGMLQVLLEGGRDLHGRFYAWNGEELPW